MFDGDRERASSSPGSPVVLYRRLRAAAERPDTSWIALVIIEGPNPSSMGEYGGESELERRYKVGRKDAGSYLTIVRSVLVRTFMIAIRDRVPESEARV